MFILLSRPYSSVIDRWTVSSAGIYSAKSHLILVEIPWDRSSCSSHKALYHHIPSVSRLIPGNKSVKPAQEEKALCVGLHSTQGGCPVSGSLHSAGRNGPFTESVIRMDDHLYPVITDSDVCARMLLTKTTAAVNINQTKLKIIAFNTLPS